jgi:predicted nucleic acid-binding protein
MTYFDTSFLIPYFLDEITSSRVERFIRLQSAGEVTISLWTHVEFSSAIAGQVRIGRLTEGKAHEINAAFDAVATVAFTTLVPAAGDFDLSRQFLKRYDTGLRAGDALHLAIASNRHARAVYSLDRRMVQAGRLLGLPVGFGLR